MHYYRLIPNFFGDSNLIRILFRTLITLYNTKFYRLSILTLLMSRMSLHSTIFFICDMSSFFIRPDMYVACYLIDDCNSYLRASFLRLKCMGESSSSASETALVELVTLGIYKKSFQVQWL